MSVISPRDGTTIGQSTRTVTRYYLEGTRFGVAGEALGEAKVADLKHRSAIEQQNVLRLHVCRSLSVRIQSIEERREKKERRDRKDIYRERERTT
jgi:hypothetical protein